MPKMIEITAKWNGFRRAGMAHHGTVLHPEGTFSEPQLALLRTEPMLVVRDVDAPEDDKPTQLKK